LSHRTEPTDATGVAKQQRQSIRRRYKQNMRLRRKIRPGQKELVTDTVLILKLVNYSNVQIGKIVGISNNQVGEILNDPKTAERFMKLKQTLSQAAYELLQTYLIEAVQVVVDIMRTETDNMVVLKAAAEIFDRAGLPKASRQESSAHRIDEKRTTLTDDGFIETLRELSPEKQEQAAQMIEQLQEFVNNNYAKKSGDSE
jgi:hypothetical protein